MESIPLMIAKSGLKGVFEKSQMIANVVYPNNDKTFLLPGENHMTSNGFHKYLGPGTQILLRDRLGGNWNNPSNKTDQSAKIHDYDYLKCDTSQCIRKADINLLNNLKNNDLLDSKITKQIFRSKIFFENKSPILAKKILQERYGSN